MSLMQSAELHSVTIDEKNFYPSFVSPELFPTRFSFSLSFATGHQSNGGTTDRKWYYRINTEIALAIKKSRVLLALNV